MAGTSHAYLEIRNVTKRFAEFVALKDVSLDVLEGDQAEVAATFKGGAAQTIGDYNNAFMQLDSGMIDVVACDLSIAQYQIAANPDKYVQLSTPSTARICSAVAAAASASVSRRRIFADP